MDRDSLIVKKNGILNITHHCSRMNTRRVFSPLTRFISEATLIYTNLYNIQAESTRGDLYTIPRSRAIIPHYIISNIKYAIFRY